MIGAIAGDVVGSVYEGGPPPPKDFPLFTPRSRFTDDTVLTVAVAASVMTRGGYAASLREWGRRYPDAGYGGMFFRWLFADDPKPYNSYGNGSAMRVSAIGWAFGDLDAVLAEAACSARVTHDHPEGVKGAQAIAGAVFLARKGAGKAEIRALLVDRFGYDCSPTVKEIRARGGFDVTCQGTVPAAAAAFLESGSLEEAIRNAVSLGGDTDTLTCIAGAMAEPFYGGTPVDIQREVLKRLDPPLRRETVAFAQAYGVPLSDDAPAA